MTADRPRRVEGSDLYRRQIAPCPDDLMRKVWDGTPWMVGACTKGRWRAIMEWCTKEFGPEAWPIHGRAGQWHIGGATVHGYTWIGFATEDMMNRFVERWGAGEP